MGRSQLHASLAAPGRFGCRRPRRASQAGGRLKRLWLVHLEHCAMLCFTASYHLICVFPQPVEIQALQIVITFNQNRDGIQRHYCHNFVMMAKNQCVSYRADPPSILPHFHAAPLINSVSAGPGPNVRLLFPWFNEGLMAKPCNPKVAAAIFATPLSNYCISWHRNAQWGKGLATIAPISRYPTKNWPLFKCVSTSHHLHQCLVTWRNMLMRGWKPFHISLHISG